MRKHTLVVAEKPDAAKRIASSIDADGKAQEFHENGVPYYIAKLDKRKNAKKIIVVPALGHLYTVSEERAGRYYFPAFNFKWIPRYVAERKAKRTGIWLRTITNLAANADEFIDACDYDLEGNLIGYWILKHACNNKEREAKRMKYSTLSEQEIQKSFAEPLPHLDFSFIEAGRARHEVDWLYGINLSRAITLAAEKWSGQYTTLSTGRVQGPTLKLLFAREESIRSFVPTPYWKIKIQVEVNGQIFEAEYEKEMIETKRKAEKILNACKGRSGQVKRVDIRRCRQPPPTPFDLGSLQSSAYSLFGYSPKHTSNIAQRLYLDAAISYPRTSSQKLPSSIDYKAILTNLSKIPKYARYSKELLAKPRLRPNEGKKDDPAHPAIYPIGTLPERTLAISEKNILNLVVRRFFSVFGEPAISQNLKIHINVNGHLFHLKGRKTLTEGWRHFYEYQTKLREVIIPPMKEGEMIQIGEPKLESKFTKPPERYNPASLVKKMEELGIGTKATRADIAQTLYDRNYIRADKIMITNLGSEVFEILEKHCPTVVSPELTRELEEKMLRIQRNSESRERVLVDVVETLKPILRTLKEKEMSIGEQLSHAIKEPRLEKTTIGTCPVCNSGKLVILHSRRTQRRFVGCTNYFKGTCKTSLPVSQKGTIEPTERNCERCGWPTIHIRIGGRRLRTSCLNSACQTHLKEERRRRN